MGLKGGGTSRALATGLLILGLAALSACGSGEPNASATTTTVHMDVSTAGAAGSTAGPELEDGVYALRIDREVGGDDSAEPFGLLTEESYQPVENGPTYRVVVSDRGSRVSVEGTSGTTRLAVEGELSSTTDGLAWYELTNTFAGGRFVVWRDAAGLQGEVTLYGSGRPIVFSERGAFTRDTSAKRLPTIPSTPSLDQEETAQAKAALIAFFQAWTAKDLSNEAPVRMIFRTASYSNASVAAVLPLRLRSRWLRPCRRSPHGPAPHRLRSLRPEWHTRHCASVSPESGRPGA